MVEVMVVGFYNKFNVGDESYKNTFPILFPEYDFVFKDTGTADICILGGGDILSEKYVNLALKANVKKRFIFSASANRNTPFELLKQFDGIIIRDKQSQKLLTEHDIPCQLAADAAFCLKPNPSAGKELLKSMFKQDNLELYSKVVGVVLNGHLGQVNDGGLTRDFLTLNKAAQDIATVADSTSASFVFFPMSTGVPHDDRVTNSMASSRCKFWRKNLVVYDRLSVQQTLDLVSCFDAVISTRLHSSIFCVLSGVPFVDLHHHDKNKSFLETCGLQDFGISYWSFGADQLRCMLNKMMSDDLDLTQARKSQEILLQASTKYVCFDQSARCDTGNI